MNKLTQERLDHLSGLLAEREKVLTAEIRRELDLQDDYGELAGEAPDTGDASFASLTLDIGNAAVMRDVEELRGIRTARLRMENGVYDECASCGLEIPYERLLAQPTAQRCAPCQAMHEKTHLDPSRGTSL